MRVVILLVLCTVCAVVNVFGLSTPRTDTDMSRVLSPGMDVRFRSVEGVHVHGINHQIEVVTVNGQTINVNKETDIEMARQWAEKRLSGYKEAGVKDKLVGVTYTRDVNDAVNQSPKTGRVLSASADLLAVAPDGGTDMEVPLTEMVRFRGFGLPTDQAGHVIAKQIGGNHYVLNVVPMSTNTNAAGSNWHQTENQIRAIRDRNYFNAKNNYCDLTMSVEFEYKNRYFPYRPTNGVVSFTISDTASSFSVPSELQMKISTQYEPLTCLKTPVKSSVVFLNSPHVDTWDDAITYFDGLLGSDTLRSIDEIKNRIIALSVFDRKTDVTLTNSDKQSLKQIDTAVQALPEEFRIENLNHQKRLTSYNTRLEEYNQKKKEFEDEQLRERGLKATAVVYKKKAPNKPKPPVKYSTLVDSGLAKFIPVQAGVDDRIASVSIDPTKKKEAGTDADTHATATIAALQKITNDQRGHLVAKALGGNDFPQNFVPLSPSCNGPGSQWNSAERYFHALTELTGKYGSYEKKSLCASVTGEVILFYADKSHPLRPTHGMYVVKATPITESIFKEYEPDITNRKRCADKTFYWLNIPHSDDEDAAWNWFLGVVCPNCNTNTRSNLKLARNAKTQSVV